MELPIDAEDLAVDRTQECAGALVVAIREPLGAGRGHVPDGRGEVVGRILHLFVPARRTAQKAGLGVQAILEHVEIAVGRQHAAPGWRPGEGAFRNPRRDTGELARNHEAEDGRELAGRTGGQGHRTGVSGERTLLGIRVLTPTTWHADALSRIADPLDLDGLGQLVGSDRSDEAQAVLIAGSGCRLGLCTAGTEKQKKEQVRRVSHRTTSVGYLVRVAEKA